jgi:hypothetical protein
MSEAPTVNYSPSVQSALLWATATAALRGEDKQPGPGSIDAFIGALLAHPDEEGEVWQLLQYFELTARDVLPDNYPVITRESLKNSAGRIRQDEPPLLSSDLLMALQAAQSLAGTNQVQIVHLLGGLLSEPTELAGSLRTALAPSGVDLSLLADSYRRFLTTIPAQEGVAGTRLGDWLANEFPRSPVALASFTSDKVDPGTDLVLIGREADAFAYLLASRDLKPPLAVGLFGDWGSGKSFLMAKIRRRIEQLAGMAAKANQQELRIWGNIKHIEFNAWEYVETNLWAALLARIFEKLSPEARKTLADRRRAELSKEITDATCDLNAAQAKIKPLETKLDETAQALEKATANREEILNSAEQRKAELLDKAARDGVRNALISLWGEERTQLLGPDLGEALAEAERVVRRSPLVLRQYWTWRRLLWVLVASAVVPAVAWAIGKLSAPPLVSVFGGLSAVIPIAAAGLRSAAAWTAQREDELIKAEKDATAAIDKRKAEEDKKVDAARKAYESAQADLNKARAHAAERDDHRRKLEQKSSNLTPGRLLAEYTAERAQSTDYRQHLSLVSLVHDNLRDLEDLTREYNKSTGPVTESAPPNRIILYIDDLDRCPPARVVQVLEAVHLLLAFELFVVVVAVDTRWLAASLSKGLLTLTTTATGNGAQPTAFDYLEKIFQLPFWVEELDDGARQRLLRGLFLHSVAGPQESDGDGPAEPALLVGSREEKAVDNMLADYGSGLRLDVNAMSITADELIFIESLAPLLGGTPRHVKRFFNICQLLLAMTPPLSATGPEPTERKATCFAAAVHEGMPQLAAALDAAGTSGTLESILGSNLVGTKERATLDTWLTNRPEWRLATVARLSVRFDIIKRMRFEASPKHRSMTPT